MKKELIFASALAFCVAALGALCGCGGNGILSGGSKAELASGTGTQDDPYVISEGSHWTNISKHLDSSFVLANDINLGDFETVKPIGDAAEPFTGKVDGKGYSVNSAKIVDDHRAGLFGVVSEAEIRNLGFYNSSVRLSANFADSDYMGSFVAVAKKGTLIENCYSKNVNVSFTAKTDKWVLLGGFAGSIESMSSVICCNSDVKISQANGSYSYPAFLIGGFAEYVSGSTVDCCKAMGSMTFGSPAGVNQMRIGTFADRISNGKITNMYSEMAITSGHAIDVYYFFGSADADTLKYCLNFCDYQCNIGGRFEKCKLQSNGSESVNIYFSPSRYGEANATLENPLWQDNRYWKAGPLHPELASYEEYLQIKQSEQEQKNS